jgi:hypothetical protein
MKWTTRAGVHIDRAACAWLIRRHIDPDAEFIFANNGQSVPEDVTAFDMPGVELSHHGGDCSFETILRRYDLTDPVLWRLAEIVHEADLEDDRYDAPEAPGLDAILRGLSMTGDDERTLLDVPGFDSLIGSDRADSIPQSPRLAGRRHDRQPPLPWTGGSPPDVGSPVDEPVAHR